MNDSTPPKSQRVAELNHHFRHWAICLALAGRFEHARKLGRILFTHGVHALGDPGTILRKVASFADFTPDNDPYGEHDFGAFDHLGQHLYWKIDYYAPNLKDASKDPSDPDITERVLTVMLAEEY